MVNIFLFSLCLVPIPIWTKNPLIFRRRPFFLVFTYFWYERGCHHQTPPRVPPFLATPLMRNLQITCVDLSFFYENITKIVEKCVGRLFIFMILFLFFIFYYFFYFYWNDRRSRRVFLCFYSAIFQLTSAKFQTFAYNSRTVGPSYMKFGQQFEINELYVCAQFRGNRSRDFGFRTQKPPRKFGVKNGFSQNGLSTAKNIS